MVRPSGISAPFASIAPSISSVSIADRRHLEKDMLAFYLAELKGLGVDPPPVLWLRQVSLYEGLEDAHGRHAGILGELL